MNDKTKPEKCPNPIKGTHCWLCGGTYICLESWRKKRTFQERIQARKAFNKERK